MRISDWSSDVCSSDLRGQPAQHRRLDRLRGGPAEAAASAAGDTGVQRRNGGVAGCFAVSGGAGSGAGLIDRVLAASGKAKGSVTIGVLARLRPGFAKKKVRGHPSLVTGGDRSEERRVGKEGVRTLRYRG